MYMYIYIYIYIHIYIYIYIQTPSTRRMHTQTRVCNSARARRGPAPFTGRTSFGRIGSSFNLKKLSENSTWVPLLLFDSGSRCPRRLGDLTSSFL